MEKLRLFAVSSVIKPPVELSRKRDQQMFTCTLTLPIPPQLLIFHQGEWPPGEDKDVTLDIYLNSEKIGEMDENTKCFAWEAEHLESRPAGEKMFLEIKVIGMKTPTEQSQVPKTRKGAGLKKTGKASPPQEQKEACGKDVQEKGHQPIADISKKLKAQKTDSEKTVVETVTPKTSEKSKSTKPSPKDGSSGSGKDKPEKKKKNLPQTATTDKKKLTPPTTGVKKTRQTQLNFSGAKVSPAAETQKKEDKQDKTSKSKIIPKLEAAGKKASTTKAELHHTEQQSKDSSPMDTENRSKKKTEKTSPMETEDRSAKKTEKTSPVETEDRSAKKTEKTSPVETEDRSTKKTEKRSPVETGDRSAKKTEKRSPMETEDRSAKKTEKRSPMETEDRSAKKIAKRSPVETEDRSAKKTEKRSPVETEDRSAKKTEKRSPVETEKRSAKKTEKRSPVKTEKRSAVETEDRSAKKTEDSSPTETEDSSPMETEDRSPEKTKKRSPKMTEERSPKKREETGLDEDGRCEAQVLNENTPQMVDIPSPLPRKPMKKKRLRNDIENSPDGPTPKKRGTRMRALQNEGTPKSSRSKIVLKDSPFKENVMAPVETERMAEHSDGQLTRCIDLTARVPRPSARWGHTMLLSRPLCAVLIGGQGDRQQLSKDSIWTLNTDTRKWQCEEVQSEGQKPENRMGHTATYDPTMRCIYIFGGSKNSRWFHDVHVFDLDENKWTLAKVEGKAPTRAYHTATIHRHELWVFGGVYPRPDPNPDGCSNDIHIFSPVMQTWYSPLVQGEKPLPRSGHSATLIRDQMVMFGGWDAPFCYNDLFILDLTTVDWSKPDVKGTPPKPRSWHASCALSNQRILIHGGYDGNEALEDSYIFDLDGLSWSRLVVPDCPKARAGHTAVCLPYTHESKEEDEVLVFGGGDNDGEFFIDLLSLAIPFKPVVEL